MKKYLILILVFIQTAGFSQNLEIPVDSLYLEDQFYLGIQYNNLIQSEQSFTADGISYSFSGGIIKDIPLNRKRNFGLGIGFGINYDLLKPMIAFSENGNTFESNNTNSNYLFQSTDIELPIELRIRTSTSTKYTFWRCYTGVSISQAIQHKTAYTINNTNINYNNYPFFQRTNYNLYTSIGYGTWNLHVKYQLNPYLDGAIDKNTQQKLNFHLLKVGLMFYIL